MKSSEIFLAGFASANNSLSDENGDKKVFDVWLISTDQIVNRRLVNSFVNPGLTDAGEDTIAWESVLQPSPHNIQREMLPGKNLILRNNK
jgi:hypothetical protein